VAVGGAGRLSGLVELSRSAPGTEPKRLAPAGADRPARPKQVSAARRRYDATAVGVSRQPHLPPIARAQRSPSPFEADHAEHEFFVPAFALKDEGRRTAVAEAAELSEATLPCAPAVAAQHPPDSSRIEKADRSAGRNHQPDRANHRRQRAEAGREHQAREDQPEGPQAVAANRDPRRLLVNRRADRRHRNEGVHRRVYRRAPSPA